MRQLHVLGLTGDGRQVLLATSPEAVRATHVIELDERVEAALRGELRAPGHDDAPAYSPREIQARLRAGLSVEQVAAEAGIPVSKVERYAGPVQSEQIQVLEAVQTAVLVRAKVGRSTLPVGAAVERNLAALPAKPETARWTAYRRDDGSWVARLSVTLRGRARRAQWALDVGSREVWALDPLAATLGHMVSERQKVEARSAPTKAAKRATSTTATKAAKATAAKPAKGTAAKPTKATATRANTAARATKATKATGAATTRAAGARATRTGR